MGAVLVLPVRGERRGDPSTQFHLLQHNFRILELPDSLPELMVQHSETDRQPKARSEGSGLNVVADQAKNRRGYFNL